MNNVFKIVALFFVSISNAAQGQSPIITFESAARGSYLTYQEQNVWFQITPPSVPYNDYINVIGSGYSNLPNNGTKFMYLEQVYGNLVSISLTNGFLFGLNSVDLATFGISKPVDITFNGYRSDGGMVSATYTTPGSGSNLLFQAYTFGSDFASGLTRVEVSGKAWAMDNLVIVPEPATWALLLAGLGVFAFKGWRRRF